MSFRLHVSVRNDLIGTPFQVYVLDVESGQEVTGYFDQDHPSLGAACDVLRSAADAIEAAGRRAGLK